MDTVNNTEQEEQNINDMPVSNEQPDVDTQNSDDIPSENTISSDDNSQQVDETATSSDIPSENTVSSDDDSQQADVATSGEHQSNRDDANNRGESTYPSKDYVKRDSSYARNDEYQRGNTYQRNTSYQKNNDRSNDFIKDRDLRKAKFKKFDKIAVKKLEIDYKKPEILQEFLTEKGKILSRVITGCSAQNQRKLTLEVKRARYVGLLPTS